MLNKKQETNHVGRAGTKRVAVASFEFEGNHFSNTVYNRSNFSLYADGVTIWKAIADLPIAVSGGVKILTQQPEFDLVPILVAQGGSGGAVEKVFFDRTVDAIVSGLVDANATAELDGIYIALHGAMVSKDINDAEGYLLQRIRKALGSHPIIAASLDLHANVTPAMVEHANILVGYETYPHVDAYDTGRRAATLLSRALRGEIYPVMRMQRLPMITPIPGGSTAVQNAPLARLAKLSREHEKFGLLSVSYFTCQPWLDDNDAVNAVVAISDNDPALAKKTAATIASEMWKRREEYELPLLSIDAAVNTAIHTLTKPVILADTGDSVGAGAAGDSSYVLEALLRLAPDLRTAISLVDATVVEKAIIAGPGSQIEVDIGFSVDPRYGTPLRIQASVVSIHNGDFKYSAGIYAGVTAHMGRTAVITVNNHHILVSSQGTYEYADEHFLSVGIDPNTFDIVVLKNGMNYRNLVSPERIAILADTVGASSANLGSLPWTNRKSPFWPRDRNVDSTYRR